MRDRACIEPEDWLTSSAVRILHGVVGEGMGHPTRSTVLLEHLTKHHDVHIVVSGRARDFLAKRFENVHNIWGFTINYEGNSVSKGNTLLQNIKEVEGNRTFKPFSEGGFIDDLRTSRGVVAGGASR